MGYQKENIQLGGMPVIPGFWDFWIYLSVREHKALSSPCSLQSLQQASGLMLCSPDSPWGMPLPSV